MDATVTVDNRDATFTPLPQRHPAAGRRFDEDGNEVVEQLARLRQQVASLQGALAEEQRKRADADVRIAAYETAERDGACPGCLGHQRTIADYETRAQADRKRIAGLELTLRSLAGAVAHAEAHRELAAEGAA